jgi:hypothetical protein
VKVGQGVADAFSADVKYHGERISQIEISINNTSLLLNSQPVCELPDDSSQYQNPSKVYHLALQNPDLRRLTAPKHRDPFFLSNFLSTQAQIIFEGKFRNSLLLPPYVQQPEYSRNPRSHQHKSPRVATNETGSTIRP